MCFSAGPDPPATKAFAARLHTQQKYIFAIISSKRHFVHFTALKGNYTHLKRIFCLKIQFF